MPRPRNYLVNPFYVPKPPPPPSGGSLVRFQPPITPIYPTPFTPPPVPPPPSSSVPSALRGFVPKALAAAKTAASFKAPPGSGAVARKAGGFAARAIPGIGWAFFALDAFLIACAAGLLPFSICQRPDNPSPSSNPGEFPAGQCPCVRYRVIYVLVETYYGTTYTRRTGVSLNGEIAGSRAINDSVDSRIEWLCRGGPFGQCTQELVWVSSFNQQPIDGYAVVRANIESITREDGQLDNCGIPSLVPGAQKMPDQIFNISNVNNNININITLPSPAPPSPLPKKAPLVLAPPAPLPDIIFNVDNNFPGALGDMGDQDFNYSPAVFFSPGGGGNYNDPPDFFNDFPPAPQPELRNPDPFTRQNPPAGSAPSLNPPPEVPPPLPDTLPPNSTDQDKYIYRQNKETLDKVYKANAEILEVQKEQQKQSKILENIQGLLDIEVQGSQLITRCDDIDIFYSYKGKILEAINQQLNQVKTIEQTIISEICQVEASAAVAAPDWWPVRLGGDIPQLALIFRVVKTRTYHTLVVPHPINTAPLTIAPIPSYKKGNWMGMITCRDNSKFICNCGTKGETTRLLFIAASLINPIFLGDPVRFYYAERKGVAVAEGDMRGTSAQYFPVGQRQTKPQWRVTFTKDGQ